MEFILEKSKNNQFTCKVKKEGKWNYVYSKYNPSNVNTNFIIDETVDFYILLGYGLGYEYKDLVKRTSKPVYIIEEEPFFLTFLKEFTTDYIYYLNVEDFQGKIANSNFQLFTIDKLVFDNNLYLDYFLLLNNRNKKNKINKIVIFDYVVITKDCADAFENLGYEVYYVKNLDDFIQKINLKEIILEEVKYLFSVNFHESYHIIAHKLLIPYIAWVVDTPCYTIYSKFISENKWSFIFHYDETEVHKLRNSGINNIFYMPIATNFKRISLAKDNEKFKSDISFLGNSCAHNEYSNIIEKNIPQKTQEKVKAIVNRKMLDMNYSFKDDIDESLAEDIFNSVKNNLTFDIDLTLMTKVDYSYLMIGRYHSFHERLAIAKVLEKNYDFNVYGDQLWSNFDLLSYKGVADHYLEMPNIFKSSIINLNLTRSFVGSGLPMRVFDIMGAGGFLLTNVKSDLTKFFVDGEHLVTFSSYDEMFEKINYYLQNPGERERIAKQGQEIIAKEHTYEIRLQQILNIMECKEVEEK